MLLVARHEVKDVRMAMEIVRAEVGRHPTRTYDEVSPPISLAEAGERLTDMGRHRLYPGEYRERMAEDFDSIWLVLTFCLGDIL